jgi:hypothetical protein
VAVSASEIASLFDADRTVVEAASLAGCSLRTVRNIAYRAGDPLPRQRRSRAVQDVLADVGWLEHARWTEGLSFAHIGRRLHVNPSVVRDAFATAGLPTSGRRLEDVATPPQCRASFASLATVIGDDPRRSTGTRGDSPGWSATRP